MAEKKMDHQEHVDQSTVHAEESVKEEQDMNPETSEEEFEEFEENDGELTIEDIMAHLQEMEDEEEEPVELSPAEQIVELIKENSSEIRLTKEEEFYDESFGFEEGAVEQYLEEIQNDEQYADIKMIEGSKTRYFYWEEKINTNYATLMVRVEEKDLIRMIVETVREQTQRYRRATAIKLFTVPPFLLNRQQILDLLEMIQQREDCADIEQVAASTGAIYLFSNKYIGKALAKSLVEWDEVERFENP